MLTEVIQDLRLPADTQIMVDLTQLVPTLLGVDQMYLELLVTEKILKEEQDPIHQDTLTE